MKAAPVIVVGAGIGGLVSALEMAHHGLDVLVLERAGQAGGKVRQVPVGEVRMDAGPTVFTMRWVFDELFDALGSTLSDLLTMEPLDRLARHAWDDRGHLDLYADSLRTADAIGRFAGAAEARGYLRFSERAGSIYRGLEGPFLRGTRPTPVSLVTRAGFRGLPDLMRISPFSSMWCELGRYFRDPRLQQLFGRYATYCGSSPFRAPGTLMLIAHVEQAGVWRIRGGMYRLVEVLTEQLLARGARIRYGATVERILEEQGRASGVRLADGECLDASAVVFNGDAAALEAGMLSSALARPGLRSRSTTRSLSAFTLNLHARCEGFELVHHTVFFSPDTRAEFDQLFGGRRLPADPTVYVCAQDRGEDTELAMQGPERLLCIVNAPAVGDIPGAIRKAEVEQCLQRTLARLRACGLTLHSTRENTLHTTPTDFATMFPRTGGAIYGQASHGWMASFNRPGTRTRLPGLHLAGGSTHPGPGVPMAALSGRLAAASVISDQTADLRGRRVSIYRSPPVATRGGISMR